MWRLIELLIARIPLPRAEAAITFGVSTWMLTHHIISEDAWSKVAMVVVGASGVDQFARGLVSGVHSAISKTVSGSGSTETKE